MRLLIQLCVSGDFKGAPWRKWLMTNDYRLLCNYYSLRVCWVTVAIFTMSDETCSCFRFGDRRGDGWWGEKEAWKWNKTKQNTCHQDLTTYHITSAPLSSDRFKACVLNKVLMSAKWTYGLLNRVEWNAALMWFFIDPGDQSLRQ